MSVLLIAGLSIMAAASDTNPGGEAQRQGLGGFFGTGSGLVRDTNRDNVPDQVAARVILPAEPSSEDVEAAVNIAGRLGFETSAMDLPVVVKEDALVDPEQIAVPILIGNRNRFVRQLADRGRLDLNSLRAGQGVVARVASPLGGGDGIVVAGLDDAGTLAAGMELAARLPRIWSMSGITLTGIEEELARFLKSRGISSSTTRLDALVVDSDRRGIACARTQVVVAAKGMGETLRWLRWLDQAHRHGQEPRSLNFANIALTTVEVIPSDGSSSAAVDVMRSGFNPRTLTPPIDPDELAPESPGERGAPGEARSAPAKDFDLSDGYGIQGWFGDAYTDLIPDRTETTLILGEGRESIGAAHIAARLGLESTGISFPITKAAAKVREPQRESSPILIGRSNPLVRQLEKIGKVRLEDLRPGEGMIQLVPRAFGNATATVVAGGDDPGTETAALHLAQRVPYLWQAQRGAPDLQGLKTEVERFLQARSGAAQAALALGELEAIARDLQGKELQSLDVKLFLEHRNESLDRWLDSAGRKMFPGAAIAVRSQSLNDPVPVFEESTDFPWEVDEFWNRFRADILPRVTPGAKVDLDVRLSESPEVRRDLAARVQSQLDAAGASEARVRMRSAYKQGFLWLTEEIIPALKGKEVASVQIQVAAYRPDLDKKYKFYTVPTRWLHELYPVDEVFQKELGVGGKAFNLELVDGPPEIYALSALDRKGREILHASFSPKFGEREYLDKFPGWSRVDVTTGWLSAVVDGRTLVDDRIPTDPERFWDYYQSKVLPRIYDQVMKITQNKPTPDKQPFHRDLDVEVWMSEPDFSIGVDEERISSLESLHEDLYFVTLDFFDVLGRTTVKQRLAAPGKIFPIIHPDRPGQPGRARILYAANASSRPKLEVSFREKGAGKDEKVTRELARIDAAPPVVTRIVVAPDRVREIELRLEARDDAAALRLADAADALRRVQEAGLYRSELSFDRLDQLVWSIELKDARTRRFIPNTGAAAPSPVHRKPEKPASPVVAWDHVISPDESEEIIAKLSAYPEVKAYKAGASYRGKEISAMEITLPSGGALVSLAKATMFKPTILITGRQHANEVSSTSHILRLAELLVTDPSYREILKTVNIILHPVENPDGAQMAFDLQKLTPTHMLHAGRYSALGMDVASQVGRADPLLPEAKVRSRLWRDWLPDIYLNPHGYPSHEWVQQFAGYVPPGFRSYLSSRGWYTSIRSLRDPRYEAHQKAVEAIRERIVQEINKDPEVRAMNLRHQERYRRWAFGFQPHVYTQEIYKDTAIYYTDPETGEPSGSRRAGDGRGGGGRFSMNAWPQVTYFSGMTESPDETAQGEWLDLVTRPGFSFLMANIRYLQEGRYAIERIEEDGPRDAVSLTFLRPRPVLPK